ncbi:phage head closure protein [Streptococcus gallolyticus]|uniref:phage head closure protein n=1 Tax=Streptococcus gallolyticus TaxID=315405 RepID=UPI002284AB86|nr:phage head closure protein [Streptococcus gallolyticus]MCY7173673.1 phage head closure protein [Streptococcus gallolyticus subsp. gallolyticus]MCY7175794.1 phage head closure protein [Streptococcus gallolyticus subsp. gallolyticus]MCY7178880.1 phage head closure protein [Streptococcus gallolyticus subsp. gallolyticus]MCY7180248.1 phage head closure protein [Streptococcus gallolyticus subsp. gallolyticus]MCY7186341.1 phage head closure protein [Streptococcus gallolyticus subsp. gallolyticus]
MAKIYSAVDFREKADFGSYESVSNPYTGVSVPKFVKKFTLHYKSHTRTLNQEYLAVSAGESETRVIVVRHNAKVIKGLAVLLNGNVYDITKVSPDEGFGINKYDFITLKKSEKVGKK